MAFPDEIATAFNDVEATAATTSYVEYRSVLDELVAGLTKLGIGAALETSIDPRRLMLNVHPMHRPGRGNLMLSFHITADSVIVSGEKPTRDALSVAHRLCKTARFP